MPTYSYECLRSGGGCGQTWKDMKSISGRYHVMCPNCYQDGLETFTHESGQLFHKVEINMDMPPMVMKGITFQDGNMGEPISLPSLGPDVRISSRAGLKDALERAREAYYKATDGEHVSHVPTEQPDGTFVMEKITHQRQGVDLGRIVPVQELEGYLNPPEDKEIGNAHRELEIEVQRRQGIVNEDTEPAIFEKRQATPDPPFELPNPRKRGRPKGSRNKNWARIGKVK